MRVCKAEASKASKEGGDDPTSADGANAKADGDAFLFEREEVPPFSVHEASLLDKMLKGTQTPLGQKAAISGNEGAVLHLTIYWPTRSEMKIDVSCCTFQFVGRAFGEGR